MRRLLTSVCASFALVAAFASSHASAGFITTTLGGAYTSPDGSPWAIFALGGTVSDTTTLNGPGTTTGNVGATSTTDLALNSSSPPAIQGNVYMGDSSNFGGSAGNLNGPGGQISGTIFGLHPPGNGVSQETVLNNDRAAAFAAASTFSALAPTQTVPGGSVNGTATITAANPGGLNVIDLTNIAEANGQVLTISGPAGTQVVINVSGNIDLHGDVTGGKILLAGGLTPSDVVFNFSGTSGNVVTSSGGSSNNLPNAQINGIVLIPFADLNMAPGMVTGEIIGASAGHSITLVSGSQVNGGGPTPPPGVPLPASAYSGLALLGALFLARKVRKAAA